MTDAAPFDLVIVADWSAAQGRKPEPCEDRCWLAWGTPEHRSEPTYAPTRLEAEDAITALIDEYPSARTLLGVDVAIGYPLGGHGAPVLPTGRDLIAMLAERVADDRSGVNNRFEIAAELNRAITATTGASCGPFWGRPADLRLDDLPVKRPAETGVAKLRACDVAARRVTKTKPKSPWQLAGAGSVGSQSLMAAPMLDRLLQRPGAALWPFEPIAGATLVIAEVYPSMAPRLAPAYWYRDARQVCDTRDWIMDAGAAVSIDHPAAMSEGWIWGVSSDAAT